MPTPQNKGRIPDDFVFPTLGIKGAPQVRRKRAFTDAELATFIRWLPRSPYSRTARDALALVLCTGCRHDLRCTAATGLAKLGCPRVVQDRILNHVNGSVEVDRVSLGRKTEERA
jgi:hypothetical protein